MCYIKTDISVCDDTLDFGFMQVRSKSALKNLENCDEAIVFAATVGIELDRAIAKYSALSQAKALILQAIGTERIESLCDMFCKEISAEMAALNKGVKNRFSPGYGDFSIETQRDIFRILKPLNKMGVFLNESLLMSPSKSVTAIIGIYNRDKV